jgi:hypothetical protein
MACEMKVDSALPLSTLRISIADMIALRVRAKGPGNPEVPEFLYQALPMTAMSIMATIPRGRFAVSIPNQRERVGGYPIHKSPPPDNDGFVIIYSRRGNERYEIADVLFQGKKLEVEEFNGIAVQWVERNAGGLQAASGKYSYFAPNRELWGAIVRDNGYTAFDPSVLSKDIAGELHEQRESKSSSGLIARIPVFQGIAKSSEKLLPVFTRVELTPDPHPTPGNGWIDFPAYQEMRERQSCPPSSIIPDFHQWLEQLTKECGFERWIFHSGMLFGDHAEWWASRDRRRTIHEGIDFAEGLAPDGKIKSIPEGTQVRAIADGEIVSVLDDFLGKTVVVRHSPLTNENGEIFHTLYSHIQIAAESVGSISKGGLLGRAGNSTNARTPAHLHLTGAWIPKSIRSSEISMEHINPGFASVILVSFNDYLNI